GGALGDALKRGRQKTSEGGISAGETLPALAVTCAGQSVNGAPGRQWAPLVQASIAVRCYPRVLCLNPGLVVRRILDRHRLTSNHERAERIHHYRKLVGFLLSDAGFCATRVRAVRNAVRVVRNAAELDVLPAHEFIGRVEEHFVRIHIAVVVRCRYCFRVEVVRPRAERADNEVVALEGLVYRRWLVHASDDGLEVVDVERPRVEVSVPAHDVEWMVIQYHL